MSGVSSSLIQWNWMFCARGEMAEAAIVAPRDMGEHAQLPRRQRAVGDGDAQHIGVKLQIEPVHQPQRLELVLATAGRRGGGAPGRDIARRARRGSGGRNRRSGTCGASDRSGRRRGCARAARRDGPCPPRPRPRSDRARRPAAASARPAPRRAAPRPRARRRGARRRSPATSAVAGAIDRHAVAQPVRRHQLPSLALRHCRRLQE